MKKTAHTPRFGVTSMGEKGQVVIPADIRASLKLEKGEKFIVIAHDRGVMLMPATNFAEMAKKFAAVEEIAKRMK